MSEEMKRDIETLKKVARDTALAVVRLESRMNGLEERVRGDLAKGFGEVMGRLDTFAGEVAVSRRERALQDASFNSLNDHLFDHEARLVRLERRDKKS